MAATFTAVAFSALAAFLKGLGFRPVTIRTSYGQEVVYERRHHGDDQLVVLVYTSCSPDGGAVRGKGKDAIRVCLVCESEQVKSVQVKRGYRKRDGRLGLSKAKRVNRVGGEEAIFGRIRDRAREMYGLANEMHRERLAGNHCECGAPLYPDSGKCVLRGYCSCKGRQSEAA